MICEHCCKISYRFLDFFICLGQGTEKVGVSCKLLICCDCRRIHHRCSDCSKNFNLTNDLSLNLSDLTLHEKQEPNLGQNVRNLRKRIEKQQIH